MKKLNVGIVGYGNIGMAIEKDILTRQNINLVCVFSKRDIKSTLGTKIEKTSNLEKYKGKIDLLFLCCGSFGELEELAYRAIENFCTIDCFDTHSKMENYSATIDKKAKENHKIALYACGWDPGIFSIMRSLFKSVGEKEANAFWGKGISQGHTNAIKQLSTIKDGVQFTVPNKKIMKKCLANKDFSIDANKKHKRVCYIVKNPSTKKSFIKKQILSIPNYFAGQKVKIKFTTQNRLNALKAKPYHKGCVISKFETDNSESFMNFSIGMESNPALTSRIMITCTNAYRYLAKRHKFGAFSMLDLPIKSFQQNESDLSSL